MKENQELDDSIVWMRRMVSHNVRMPMSIIRGYGDVLRNNLLNEREKQEAIDSICENIVYLDKVISVIFDSGTKDEIMMTRVNIVESLKTVTGYVTDMAKKNQIRLNTIIEKEELYIEAETILITRIFYQLYENAFKYLNAGNAVSFSMYQAGGDILVVYKDDGPGIEEDETECILEKGFRGKNSKNKTGSGIGLYDIAEIVKRFNGTIEVRSSKGRGFSVFITFPVSKEQRKGTDGENGENTFGRR